jgi:hypothetical protein
MRSTAGIEVTGTADLSSNICNAREVGSSMSQQAPATASSSSATTLRRAGFVILGCSVTAWIILLFAIPPPPGYSAQVIGDAALWAISIGLALSFAAGASIVRWCRTSTPAAERGAENGPRLPGAGALVTACLFAAVCAVPAALATGTIAMSLENARPFLDLGSKVALGIFSFGVLALCSLYFGARPTGPSGLVRGIVGARLVAFAIGYVLVCRIGQ